MHRNALHKVENAVQNVDDSCDDDNNPDNPFLPYGLTLEESEYQRSDGCFAGSIGQNIKTAQDEVPLQSVDDDLLTQVVDVAIAADGSLDG